MAEDNQTQEQAAQADFTAMFQEVDAIEDPGGSTWQNDGYPEDMGLAMDDAELAKQARRAGLVPPEERGDPPQRGPDTLPEYDAMDADAQAAAYGADGEWSEFGDPEPDIDPVERAAQDQIDALMANQAEREDVEGSIEPPMADESDEDEDEEEDAKNQVQKLTAGGDYEKNETAPETQPGNQPQAGKQPQQQQQQGVPGGPLSALSGAVASSVGSLARGGAYLAAAGVSAIGAAGLYSARGAKWGWNANKHQRSRAHRSQVERTVERASTVNEKFARGLGKLEGTEYQGMASERAELMKKANPTADERGKITSLAAQMSSAASADPTVRDGLRDITRAIRDSEQVSRQMPAHVRKGAIDEDEARNKLEAMREPLGEHADEARGMVDGNGKETGERARRMMEKFSEMLKKIFEVFSLRRQKTEQNASGAEMAAG